MSKEQTTSNGVGVVGVLQIMFIVLKLIGTITWSWWWVLAPTWITIVLFVVILIIALLVATVTTLIKGRKNK